MLATAVPLVFGIDSATCPERRFSADQCTVGTIGRLRPDQLLLCVKPAERRIPTGASLERVTVRSHHDTPGNKQLLSERVGHTGSRLCSCVAGDRLLVFQRNGETVCPVILCPQRDGRFAQRRVADLPIEILTFYDEAVAAVAPVQGRLRRRRTLPQALVVETQQNGIPVVKFVVQYGAILAVVFQREVAIGNKAGIQLLVVHAAEQAACFTEPGACIKFGCQLVGCAVLRRAGRHR